MNVRSEELVPENIIFNNAGEVPPPTYYEVNQVTEKLKIHKAAGSDNIRTSRVDKTRWNRIKTEDT
jgi:hypothetical protein